MRYVAIAVVLVFAAALQAPPAKPPRVGWYQSAATVAEANGYSYKIYRDGATWPLGTFGVTCTEPTPDTPRGSFNCSADFPATTPGIHTMLITATDKRTGQESNASNPLIYNSVPTQVPIGR